ncbi:MAG: hypothetical protein LBR61_06285 [Synergistaceae bacterium]|nr:hypothetical protein [Synergistaceae bacterium]
MVTKIGIVGPQTSVDRVIEAIRGHVMYVEPVPLPYRTFQDAVSILRGRQSEVDCVLFTGSTPYRYVLRFLRASCPWEYIPQSLLSLVCSLLQAAYVKGLDIRRASFDSYNESLIHNAYRQAGYAGGDIEPYFAGFSLFEENYIDLLCRFHKQLFESGRTTCCVTGIVRVFEFLTREGVPCIIISNVTEVIVQQINKLRLDLQSKMMEEFRLAAVEIEIAYQSERTSSGPNILQQFYDRSAVSEPVYMFAQRLGAALVESPPDHFSLFTTQTAIRSETGDFKRFDPLRMFSLRGEEQKIFVGIGIGGDASQSQHNARLALRHARSNGVSCMFAVHEDQLVIGPVTDYEDEESQRTGAALSRVSERTGVGLRTLTRLDGIVRQHHLRDTTARELADLYGINLRSMNRILLKLETGGYLTVVGKESSPTAGRPGRIVRINLKK